MAANLLAELQAKQKARASSVVLSGPPPPLPGGGVAAAAPTGALPPPPSTVGASGHVVPPPRPIPPPPPPKSHSVVLSSPPLAGQPGPPPIPAGSAGGAPLVGADGAPAPTLVVPPPRPAVRPPPLPPASSRPPPPPPPQQHHVSIAPSTQADPMDDADTPMAPDTPTGNSTGHRHGGSFSMSAAPNQPLPAFSTSPNPLSPPPSMPLPQLPGSGVPSATPPMPAIPAASGLTSGTTNMPQRPPPPPRRVVLPDANRTLYLNADVRSELDEPADGSDASAAAPAQSQFRLDMSGSEIKLARTVKVYTERQENRFVDDFVPSIPPAADALVASSLTAFNRPIKAFLRTHVKYNRVFNPNAAPTGVVMPAKVAARKDKELVEFEVDEPFRQGTGAGKDDKDGKSGGVGDGAGVKEPTKRKAGGLADLFQAPDATTSPSPPSAPAAASGSSVSPPMAPERAASEGATSSASLAAQQAEESARQAEIESLVKLSLQNVSVTPAAAHAAAHSSDESFARKEENLFLRSHPSFEWQESVHKAEYAICKRLPTSASTGMWSRDQGTQFLVSLHALRIGVGNIEPLFGTLALYDLKQGVRLTEDFHFDLNDNSLLTGSLEVTKSTADPITLCQHALFSVADKHDSVYLVLRLERVLQGDPAEMEHYFKLRARTPLEMQTLVKKTRGNLVYLSDYRQPFGWAMLPLFEETGELKNWSLMAGGAGPHERGSSFVRMDKIFLQVDSLKEDMFVTLLRETRENVAKGGKTYPGCYFDARIEEMNEGELPPNRYDVSYIQLKNTEPHVRTVTDVAEYNVAADTPLPSNPGGAQQTTNPSPASSPGSAGSALAAAAAGGANRGGSFSISVPPTPLAADTPATPMSVNSASGGSGGAGAAAAGSAAAAAAGGPAAPAHTTPLCNNPLPYPPMIREVEPFAEYAPPLSGALADGAMLPPTPHTFFVNLMYVYPEFIKFEKFRNIACRVQFRSSDANVTGEGMKVIRGKSSGPQWALSALTQVNYHRKALTPQDEIKILLPLSCTSQTHLFFTFYKVSCKTKPGKREIIGYSALPLYHKSKLLVDDMYALPIAAKLPKNYLQPFLEGKETDELHFRHAGAPCFNLRVRLVSSIFSQDEHIYAFLHTFPNSKELIAAGAHHGKELLHKAVEHVHKLNPWYTVKFLPPLLDYFFELIQNRATPNLPGNNANQIQASYYAFLGLTYLVYRISEYYGNEGGAALAPAAGGSNRCSILVAYITHRLENLQTPSVMMQGSASIPNALGVEAGPASTTAPAASASTVTYVPLYAVFAKLWLVGLNPGATSDNANLFTLPSQGVSSSSGSSGAGSASNLLSPPSMGSAAAGGEDTSSAGAAASSTSSSIGQTLHERLLISYAWFYFEVIYKSLVLERDRQQQVATQAGGDTLSGFHDDPHLLDFLRYFESLLGVIVSIVTKHRTVGLTSVKHLVHNLALFLNDLYSVLEKPRVVHLVTTFLLGLRRQMNYNDPVLVEILFTFYHILFDFEFFMDVCEVDAPLPEATPAADNKKDVSADADEDDSPYPGVHSSDLLSRIRSKYPVIAVFIADFIAHCRRTREGLIRENIINTLRLFLTKHDWDQRWQSAKPAIAIMFLPLLPALMEEMDIIKSAAEKQKEKDRDQHAAEAAAGGAASASSSADPKSGVPLSPLSPTASGAGTGSTPEEAKLRRNLLICILWVMKNVPLSMMKEWWSHDLLAYSGVAGRSRGDSESSRTGSSGIGDMPPHSETPHIDFMALLEYCITSFPYAGIHKRETDTEYDSILSPESIAAFMGEGGGWGVGGGGPGGAGGGVNDIKSDIEALMSNIHKTRTLGGGTLRSARGSTIGGERNNTIGRDGLGGGGGTTGKSTLRQLRAQLANKPQTIGPGGLNMQALAAGGMGVADSLSTGPSTGTIGRAAGVSFASTTGGGGGMTTMGTYRATKTLNSNTMSLTQSSREYLLKLVRWEGYLSRAVSGVVVRMLHEYLEDWHAFVTAPARRSVWLEDEAAVESHCLESFLAVIRLFTALVSSNQSTQTLLQLFPTMLLFLHRYGTWFHLNPAIKRCMGQFTSTAFRLCAFASREVRGQAVALMYSLLCINYALDGNVFNLQMQLTIELSKLTENLSLTNEKYLQNSIQALMRLAAAASGTGAPAPSGETTASSISIPPDRLDDFKSRVDTLLHRLSTILSDSMEISRQAKLGADADTATSEALLVQIADAFSHIPEIRIEWLNRLAQHHQRHEQYAEAGQCYIQMAQLVTAKAPVAPSADGGAEGYTTASDKTAAELDKLVCSYYESACRMLDKAELYEQCSDVYKLLQPLYHRYRDYKSLSSSHLHLHQVFEKLMEVLKNQSRMLGTYYRIGFYGVKFGERLNGQEFIYKLPKITRIMEITSRMKSLYSTQLGVPVRVLPDSGPVDSSKLDPEECVLQITFVAPYFPADTGAEPSAFERDIGLRTAPRVTWIDQNTGIQAFKFSTPFTSGGKAFGNVTEQQKRNTVLYVRSEFPHILTAQPVVKRQETVLSPIASATEDVNLRTNALLELLQSETLDAKVLTGLLAGSVATQVHGGSKEICQAFLTPPAEAEPAGGDADAPAAAASPWSDSDQSKLRAAMRKFVDACVLGLEANRKLADGVAATDAQREFQRNLDTQFQELTLVINPLIRESATGKKKSKVKKGVRFG